jgi:hypothetical protein
MYFFVATLFFGFSAAVIAAPSKKPVTWVEIKVPETYCARGEQYKVFLKYRSPEKVMIGFQSGGACWSHETCSKISPLAKQNPGRGIDSYGALRAPDLQSTYMKDASMIYFPYCTGDVYTGSHVADYDGFTIHHFGGENVRRTMAYLRDQNFFDFSSVTDLVQYGSSAGAIGAISHIRLMDSFFTNTRSKVLLADSPGLHWGKNFFNRFKGKYKAELIGSLRDAGAFIDESEGNVAKDIDTFCNSNPTWNMAFLQSTKDIVMSLVFGEVNPWKHQGVVLSKLGLYETAKAKTQNCSVYLKDGFVHVFFDKNNVMTTLVEGMSPQNFVQKIFEGINKVFLPKVLGKPAPKLSVKVN